MIKLSEYFKARKIQYYTDENGIPKEKVIDPIPEGELLQKNLNLDDMNKLAEQGKSHDTKTPQQWNEFCYDILDILFDIEKDVSKKDFCEAMIISPNSYFEFLKERMNERIIDMLKIYKNKVNSEKKLINNMTKTMEELPEEIKKDIAKTMEEKNKELNKTDEEKLIELAEKIKNEKDINKQKELLLEQWKIKERINKKLQEQKEANQAKIAENEQKIKEFDKKKEEEKKDNIVDVVPKTEE